VYFSNDFLQTILLLGIIQGGILSGMLFLSIEKHYMNRFIGTLILFVSLACLNGYFFHARWFQTNKICQILHAVIPLILVMPFGPLIFFYTKSVLHNNWRLEKNERRHFYPVVIDLAPYSVALIYIAGHFSKLLPNNPGPWGLFIDTYNTYADIPRWLSISVYLYSSYKLIKTDSNKKPFYNWLRLFITAFAAFQFVWLCFMIPYLVPQYNIPLLNSVGWYPVLIPLVVLIYWAGIKGYIVIKTETSSLRKENKCTARITQEAANQVLVRLTRLMEEEHLYLKPDLNLELVSKHIDIAPKVISTVLNNHLQQSFSQWLNGYRVAAFKQRILTADSGHLTLAGMAFECGFNSQASFQRIFKQYTGMVPSEYRDSGVE